MLDVLVEYQMEEFSVFKHKNTKLYEKLEKKELNIPEPIILQIPYTVEVPYMILADKAFELNDYFIKPFRGSPESGSIERIFNYRISRARRVVENAFGIAASVFRVLRKPLLLEPEKAKKIILAVMYLHNFLRKRSASTNLYTPNGTFDSEQNGELIPARQENRQAATRNAQRTDVRYTCLGASKSGTDMSRRALCGAHDARLEVSVRGFRLVASSF
ncbi:hypothetical protein EVAR_57703_1 [Eumeta japonica]|uniref:DDE Tnp4 domain-containing protein n=1 Tax=Eumeta variegata TaxID=151549 RepID=A0A4C1Y9M4_EUMVA|nr:hypothetical protein EVAR_57703_1 [Eumeta japonica]